MRSSLLYLYYLSQLIHCSVLTVLLYIINTLFGCFMFCLQQDEHGMDFRSSCWCVDWYLIIQATVRTGCQRWLKLRHLAVNPSKHLWDIVYLFRFSQIISTRGRLKCELFIFFYFILFFAERRKTKSLTMQVKT